ncbi:MAG: hypothetical protein WDA11_09810 [Thiohalomonadaceae bacterium]
MNATQAGDVSPLEIRQHPYGWSITCLDGAGRIRHVTRADTELQAYRAARQLALIYRVQGRARVSTPRGDYYLDLSGLQRKVSSRV